ncbi:MAG TPA: efflux RND transporter periplasmic adaptor subunit [Pirellulaceae bacterium]|nr:efflux RND transporter periplasmic adaptor subunit [Pirellulaceae bacterium]
MATITTPTTPPIAAAQGWLAWITRALPNALVLCLLAAIFAIGHRYHWKLPKLSALLAGAPAAADDWCDEHLVPESICLECRVDPKAQAKPIDWCAKHGVAECVICHPERAQTKTAPQLPAYDTAAAIGVRPRAANNSLSTLHTKVVQFASPEAVDKAGVAVDVVGTAAMREEIAANGEVVFDPTRVAHLSPRVAGTVWQVYKQLGQEVHAGELLALIDAAAVGQSKAELLQAAATLKARQANVDRLRGIKDVVANKALVEAESALREAEIKVVSAGQSLVNLGFQVPAKLHGGDAESLADEIRYLGIPEEMIATVKEQTQTANLFPLVAPIGGVVVVAEIVRGEFVSTTTPAFVVADPQKLWLNLSVRQEDAPLVQLGQRVQFETENQPRAAEGKIDWISPTIDHKSRTLPIRVSLDNAAGQLRDNTFGVGRIILREESQSIVVPKSAVQSAGDVQLVFVRDKRYFEKDAPKFFHVRQVRVGAKSDKQVELLAGVLPGEVVATTGSNVLVSQLLRSQLGAGCGCHDGHSH